MEIANLFLILLFINCVHTLEFTWFDALGSLDKFDYSENSGDELLWVSDWLHIVENGSIVKSISLIPIDTNEELLVSKTY